MNHINKIIDADPHFTIDPISRRIRNESSKKVTLIQGDHNSERFSFELPRFVEGHDMLECNRVEVHFINIENGTGNRHEDMYDVKDMQTHPDNPEHVAFSWLITDNATKYGGSLAFGIRFCCTDTDNVADYVWKTAVNKDIKISEGMNTAESVDEAIPDIIAQWEDKVLNGYVDNYTFKKSYDNDSLKEITENEISNVPSGKTGITVLKDIHESMWGYLFDVGTFEMLVCRDDLADGGKIYIRNMVFGDFGFEWSEWEDLTASSSSGDTSVDNSIAIWNPNTAYAIGDVVLILNPFLGAAIIGTCKLSHTSSSLSDLMENIGSYWDYEEINANKASSAIFDDEGNVIRITYATKEDLQADFRTLTGEISSQVERATEEINSHIEKIENGEIIVDKAGYDAMGNMIHTTYATIEDLEASNISIEKIINTEGGSDGIVVYEAKKATYDLIGNDINLTYASKTELTNAIGDIETSLENIIAKYGLGGETV